MRVLVNLENTQKGETMTNQTPHTTKQNRIHWMDNLRTIAIFLVVLYHAAGVYSLTFQSFWLVSDPATSDVVGILNILLDVTAIPTIFFISGYLIPMSLKDKSARAFVWSKFKRLMIPWFVAVLTLIPLYKVIFLASRGLPQEHWTTYFHFSVDNLTSQNWLWFLPVLFSFSVLYMLLSKANIRIPNISLKWAVIGASVIGFVYSVGIGMVVGFRHWTKTPLIDFETEKLLPYFLIFLLGALCFRDKVFEVKPKKQTMYIVVSSIAWMPITLHIMSRVIWVLSMGTLGGMVSPFVDRLIWWLGFDLSVLCMIYLMVQSFWRYLDRTGWVWDELNRNSYGVYIIHVIVVGTIALLLLNVTLPAMIKWLVLTVSAYGASNLIASLYRRAVDRMKRPASRVFQAIAKENV
jgi:peptidoglycan/LPS O-acetylase OafA/YrhL